MTRTLLILTALLSFGATAEEPAPSDGFHIGVDTDPSMFALGGYSGWAMLRIPVLNGVKVGGGLFALDVPSPVSTLLNGGKPGFAMRLTGTMGHASAFLTRDGRGGLYTGAYVGALETSYKRGDSPGQHADVWHVTAMPMIGYQWFPLANDLFTVPDFPGKDILAGVYLEPWVGASLWFKVAGQPVVGGKSFSEPPGVPFPALHIGFEL